MKHDYQYDINQLLGKAERNGMDHLAGFVLQLDDFLYELEEMTPEMQRLLDKTFEFLVEATSEA